MFYSPINEDDHCRGNQRAPVIIVEYGDYQCSHCEQVYWEIKKLQKYVGEEMCFVFRNFPLSQVHPEALDAALAAEAAGLQAKFWAMHDAIFENQNSLKNGLDGILLLAESVFLNTKLLLKDMQKKELKEKVQNDFESGMRSGVNGTPTFFINGHRYNGIKEFDEMLEAVQQILQI